MQQQETTIDSLCGYVCFFSGRRFECKAPSLYAAKMKAVEHFKPRSNQVHKISVTLAEKWDKPVIHTADF